MRASTVVALSFLAIATSALADAESLPNFAHDTLSGDWGGGRSAAAKGGFLFEGGIKVDALRNSGGTSGTPDARLIGVRLELAL